MATLQFLACFLLLAVGATNAQGGRFRTLPPGAQLGDDCTSTLRYTSCCGEPILLGSTQTPVTDVEGPNVCNETRMYMQATYTYTYQEYCSRYGRRRCSTYCRPNACNGTMINFTRSALKCCDGFAEGDPMPTPEAAGSSFSRFYRLLGFYSRSQLRTNGCPVVLRDSVAECLEELGLNSFLSEVVGVPGLEDRLSSEDEASTVFALSDEVFASLSDLDRALLFSVSAHIGEGQFPEKKLFRGCFISTLTPNVTVHIGKTGNRTVQEHFVNGIRISETNACQARNGVVHIVDGIIPSSSATINDLLVDQSRFSIFQNLAEKAEIAQFLDDPVKSRTVFAPTNEAFDEYPGLVDCLCNANNSWELTQFVLFHIASPAEYTSTLSQRSMLYTFSCYFGLRVNSTDEGIFLTNDAIPLIDTDITANNGVIHAIPEVLLLFREATLNRICPDIDATMAPSTEQPTAVIVEPEATPDPDGIPPGGVIIPPESVGR